MKPPANVDPRQLRLAQALRANLARRKAQIRARGDDQTEKGADDAADAAPADKS